VAPSQGNARSRYIGTLVRGTRATRVLSSLGYQSDHDPPPLDRHLPEMRLPGRCGAVEVHIEALSFNARSALSTEEVWRVTEARNYSGANFLALPPQWHLLHGMLHHQLSDRCHARRILALKGLWEFANVARDVPPSGWNAIIAHANEREIVPSARELGNSGKSALRNSRSRHEAGACYFW